MVGWPTVSLSSRSLISPDQPRLRGEHALGQAARRAARGSAPPARGTRPVADDRRDGNRISPACAGNTGGWRYWLKIGSAPPARGTPHELSPGPQEARISPACAGNTGRPGQNQTCPPDQPRLRGEHPVRAARYDSSAGSAPPARGTPAQRVSPAVDGRISPACAGNTPVRACAGFCLTDQPRLRGEHIPAQAAQNATGGSAPPARGTQSQPLPRCPG